MKPKVINLYFVLKDVGAAANMKKQENFHPFGLDYLTAGEEKIKLDVAVGMYEVIEESAFEHPIGAKNWMTEYGLPENTYCINNATETETGFMTGFFSIYHGTPELLAVITVDAIALQTFLNWFENKVKEFINLYKTTGFEYTDHYGNLKLAMMPKGMTLTTPKTVQKPGKEKVGEYWRKVTVDASTIPSTP